MLNEKLVERANYIFNDIGGYDYAKKFYSDNEITDICLFNGFTIVIFPSCGGETSYINMTDIDYKENTEVFITDRNNNLLYRTIPSRFKNNYYIGLSNADIIFLKSLSSDSLQYLVYATNTGPNMAQLIVSQQMPQYELNILNKNKEDEQERQKLSTSQILLESSAYSGFYTYSSNTVSNEYDLVYGSGDIEVAGPINQRQILITFKRDIYITFRYYSDYSSGLALPSEKAAIESFLTSKSYTIVYVDEDRSVYIKDLGSNEYAEMIIDYVADAIDMLKESKYKVLELDKIAGYNANRVVYSDNVYSLIFKPSYRGYKGIPFNSINKIYEIGATLI
jgi:hypothetical protein